MPTTLSRRSTLERNTDHLGNVRAVIKEETGNFTGTDYYPFGMPMPLRNSLSDYRYAFQGQEKDPETGKEAFQLRLWDARIGRWLTTDPYGQYHSPYLGMGNDPINGIDPDGGWKTKVARTWGWVKSGLKGKLSDFGTCETCTGQGKYNIGLEGGFIATKNSDLAAYKSGFDGYVWNNEGTSAHFFGSISSYTPTTADKWADGNFAQQAAYGTANAFSVVGQSMNPFDNQVTTLRGEDITDKDRGQYGAEVAATLIPIGSAKLAMGPTKQWIRYGSSYSHHLSTKTSLSIRWGASPGNKGKYLKQIPSSTMRTFNQWIRKQKLPGNGSRVADPGHFHIKF